MLAHSWSVARGRRWVVLACALGRGLAATIMALVARPVYSAAALVMPPEEKPCARCGAPPMLIQCSSPPYTFCIHQDLDLLNRESDFEALFSRYKDVVNGITFEDSTVPEGLEAPH